MKTRMDRYKDISLNEEQQSRSNKNQELYQNIGTNAKYTNFTDVSKSNAYMYNPSKKNNYTRESYQHIKEYTNIAPKTRVKKELDDFNHLYQDHENRVYDINSVLEKARENRKEIDEREAQRKLKNTNYNILASLNPEELEKYRKEKQKRIKPDEDEIRELIDTIASKTLAGEISKDTGVDLLSDLMATSAMDRVAVPEKEEVKKEVKKEATSTNLEMSRDILDKDAMKRIEQAKKDLPPATDKEIMKDLDQSFYTKSMDLSDKDFFTGDSEDDEKKIPVFVKILMVLLLIGLIGVSIYFVYQSF